MKKSYAQQTSMSEKNYKKAIANFVVCNFENDAKSSPHSYLLDVTVRTDSKVSSNRIKKKGV